MTKEIMVDLDNTLVNFTQMLFNHIEDNFGFIFREEQVLKYDFCDLFFRMGLNKLTVINIFNTLYQDETLYTDKCIKTKYYNQIVKLLRKYKKLGYKITCHTKVSSEEMKTSKEKYFKKNYRNLFDNIIIDLIQGKEIIESTKDHHYDIIIDDSPFVVKNYLNNNPNGTVFLPVTKYNEFLLNDENYSNRIQTLKEDK